MLSDEEIIQIAADTKTGEPGLHGYILQISFAREIERAALAKASQQVHGDLHHAISVWYAKLTNCDAVQDDGEHVGYCCPMKMMDELEEILVNYNASTAPKQESVANDYNLALNIYDGLSDDLKTKFKEYVRDTWPSLNPAQAAAIPDEINDEYADEYTRTWNKGWNACRASMLSSVPKPEGE